MCQNPLLDYLEPTTKHHDGLQPVAILIHLEPSCKYRHACIIFFIISPARKACNTLCIKLVTARNEPNACVGIYDRVHHTRSNVLFWMMCTCLAFRIPHTHLDRLRGLERRRRALEPVSVAAQAVAAGSGALNGIGRRSDDPRRILRVQVQMGGGAAAEGLGGGEGVE